MSNIVNVIVNVLPASKPNTLQQTAVIVTQGGTTLSTSTAALPNGIGTGCTYFISQVSDFNAIAATQAINTMAWASGIVTATVTGGHGFTTGQTISLTISGNTSTGYNGTFSCTITSSTQFTYAVTSNPGTSGGTPVCPTAGAYYAKNDLAEYFNQAGANIGVFVLELGAGTAANGIASLNTWIQNNPKTVYSYKLPGNWAADSTLVSGLLNNYTGNKSWTYFYFDSASTYWSNFIGLKSAVVGSNSPNSGNTESLASAMIAIVTNYAPSAIHKVPQAAYTFLFGCTAWPLNNASIVTMENGYINYAASGAEGGISNVILKLGTYQDGTQLNHWYAIDWVAIQVQQALAAAIINGSNNTVNPLYYNQAGINTLTAVAQNVVDQAVSYGLIGGSPVVNNIPYSSYTTLYPNDYGNGIYNGLSAILSTQNGFLHITFTAVFTSAAP